MAKFGNRRNRTTNSDSLIDILKSAVQTIADIDDIFENWVTNQDGSRTKQKLSKKQQDRIKNNFKLLNSSIKDIVAQIQELEGITQDLKKSLKSLKDIVELPSQIQKILDDAGLDDIDFNNLDKISINISKLSKSKMFVAFGDLASQLNSFESIRLISLIEIWACLKGLRYILKAAEKFGLEVKVIQPLQKSIQQGFKMLIGIIKDLSTMIQELEGVKFTQLIIVPLKIRQLIQITNRLSGLLWAASSLVLYSAMSPLIVAGILGVDAVIGSILIIFNKISEIEFKDLVLSRLKIKQLIKFASNLSGLIRPAIEFSTFILVGATALAGLSVLKLVIEQLLEVVGQIADLSIKDLVLVRIKTKYLIKTTHRIHHLMLALLPMSLMVQALAAPLLIGLMGTWMILSMFKNIIGTIKSTKVGLLLNIKIKMLTTAAFRIHRLLKHLVRATHVRGLAKATLRMLAIKILIASFAEVIIAMTLMAPIMAIFLLISPILILVFAAFAVVFRVMTKLIAKALSPQVLVAILTLTATIGVLALLAISLVVLAVLVKPIIDNAMNLLLFLGIVVIITIAIAALGGIISLASPLITAAVIGIGLVALGVFAILAMAAMLWLLTKINLDTDVVKDRVRTIIETVKDILIMLFWDDIDEPGAKDSVFKKIVNVIGGAATKIFMALAGAVILLASVVVVFSILLIASLLRLLQNLNLDTNKIKENVATVIGTVQEIINQLFVPDQTDSGSSPHGILGTIINWVSPELGKIVQALLAAAFLFISVVAIASILLLAGMLRGLQALSLDKDKITQNINDVFDIIDTIVSRVFDPINDTEKKSSRGILGTIISFVDKGLAQVIEAVFTIVYMGLAVAAVAMVMLLAGMLRGLQAINLDRTKIEQTITDVFDICDLIMSHIFSDPDDEGKPSSRGIFGTIISWFEPGLASIIDGLMAIAKMGLVFVSLALVTGIATQLRSIQSIELDKDAIISKVDSIFETAGYIMEWIMQKSDQMLPESKESSLFSTLIGFFTPIPKEVIDAMVKIAQLSIVNMALGAIASIADNLQAINDLQVDLNAAQSKVTEIMAVAKEICAQIFSEQSNISFPVPPAEEETIMSGFLKLIGFSKSDSDRAIEAALKKVEQLGIIASAVGALCNIQEQMKTIMDIDFADFTGAQSKVQQLMSTAAQISEYIFGTEFKITFPEPTDSDMLDAFGQMGWFEKLTTSDAQIKSEAAIIAAMKRIESLAMIAGALGSLASIADNLVKISEFEIPENAKTQVGIIMQAASDVAAAIFEGFTKYNAAWTIKPSKAWVQQNFEPLLEMTTQLETYSNHINAIMQAAEFSNQDVLDLGSKFTTSADVLGEIIIAFNGIDVNTKKINENLDILDRISSTVGSFVKVNDSDVKNTEKLTDNYIKFMKQVDSMDFKKLQTTEWMMRHFASISRDIRGDFEGLAKTVNQHIMPALEKLNETMDKVTKCQSEIIDELSKPVDINMPGTGTLPNLPTGIDNNPGQTLGTPNPVSPGTTPTVQNTQTTQTQTNTQKPKTAAEVTKGSRTALRGLNDLVPGQKYKGTFVVESVE